MYSEGRSVPQLKNDLQQWLKVTSAPISTETAAPIYTKGRKRDVSRDLVINEQNRRLALMGYEYCIFLHLVSVPVQ